MKIAHFAPFAPMRCGLYEAARDMIVADTRAGHRAILVDVGVTIDGKHVDPTGGVDERGGSVVGCEPFEHAIDADVIVAHTGIPDNWIVRSQAPIIWILHGRPLACFRPEQNTRGQSRSYSLMADLARWPRIKKMVSFWPEHAPFWEPIIPQDKLVMFAAPPVDETRFSPDGPLHEFKPEHRGNFNVLIADSWREDVDIYEIAHAPLQAAQYGPGLKVHFYAMETPLGPWENILAAYRRRGILGEVCARMPNMEQVYRAVDCLLTPHRISTRVMAEALSCGTPVVAAQGCAFTHETFAAPPDDPEEMARALDACRRYSDGERRMFARSMAKGFRLANYSEAMREVYVSVVDSVESEPSFIPYPLAQRPRIDAFAQLNSVDSTPAL